jgi:hypothetical protein
VAPGLGDAQRVAVLAQGSRIERDRRIVRPARAQLHLHAIELTDRRGADADVREVEGAVAEVEEAAQELDLALALAEVSGGLHRIGAHPPIDARHRPIEVRPVRRSGERQRVAEPAAAAEIAEIELRHDERDQGVDQEPADQVHPGSDQRRAEALDAEQCDPTKRPAGRGERDRGDDDRDLQHGAENLATTAARRHDAKLHDGPGPRPHARPVRPRHRPWLALLVAVAEPELCMAGEHRIEPRERDDLGKRAAFRHCQLEPIAAERMRPGDQLRCQGGVVGDHRQNPISRLAQAIPSSRSTALSWPARLCSIAPGATTTPTWIGWPWTRSSTTSSIAASAAGTSRHDARCASATSAAVSATLARVAGPRPPEKPRPS